MFAVHMQGKVSFGTAAIRGLTTPVRCHVAALTVCMPSCSTSDLCAHAVVRKLLDRTRHLQSPTLRRGATVTGRGCAHGDDDDNDDGDGTADL